jgi:hypothetical protein
LLDLSPASDTDGEDVDIETATPALNLNPLLLQNIHLPIILLHQPYSLLLTYLQLHLVDLNVLTKVRSLKGRADMCQAYQGRKQSRLFLFVSRWLSSRAHLITGSVFRF